MATPALTPVGTDVGYRSAGSNREDQAALHLPAGGLITRQTTRVGRENPRRSRCRRRRKKRVQVTGGVGARPESDLRGHPPATPPVTQHSLLKSSVDVPGIRAQRSLPRSVREGLCHCPAEAFGTSIADAKLVPHRCSTDVPGVTNLAN